MVDVSVVLPFRNAAATLARALRSLLDESSIAIEVLAIDDGSTDTSVEVARGLSDSRVRVVQCEGAGLVAALETGRRHARAPFIARMDADDVSLPGRLSKQHRTLVESPKLGVLGSRVRVVGGAEGLERYGDWQNALCTPEDHRRELFVESPLCHPSVMMRASAVEAVGGYRAGDFPEDYDLWLRLDAAGWQLAKVPQTLLEWHHREGRATFADPRYRIEAFHATKAPFVAARLEGETRSIVTWGAGRTGRRIMRTLEPQGVKASLWIDIDPAKIGRTARGAPIASMESLRVSEHFVLAAVGARGARALIRDALLERGFREGDDFLFLS